MICWLFLSYLKQNTAFAPLPPFALYTNTIFRLFEDVLTNRNSGSYQVALAGFLSEKFSVLGKIPVLGYITTKIYISGFRVFAILRCVCWQLFKEVSIQSICPTLKSISVSVN